MIYGYLDPGSRIKAKRVYGLTMCAGGTVLHMGTPIPEDATTIIMNGIMRGGEHLYREVASRGLDYYYIDNSYFEEFKWSPRKKDIYRLRVTKNAWVNSSIVERPKDRSPNIKLQDWRPYKGDYVLILPPSEQTAFVTFSENWLDETIKQFEGHNIKVRKKPDSNNLGQGLEEDLEGAYLVASHSSSVLVDAMCKGFRTWTTHGATREVNNLDNFDRQRVINHLSYSEFTYDELYNGYAWSVLNGSR